MWIVNQKIISLPEPNLGPGVITRIDTERGIFTAEFPETKTQRTYSLIKAPVRAYDETLDHAAPALRSLFSRELTNFRSFDLRKEAWALKSKHVKLPSKGLLGARIFPIPHQLYIAWEVSRRLHPRVLLADEVGLGKTIEAGLIFSRLKTLGRAERVLILVPPSLVHQWTAEMFRRFGELFAILDESRSREEETAHAQSPFEANQKVISSLDFLAGNPLRLEQALAAQWDLLIIDEAHKLEWDLEEPSKLWLIARGLATISKGLLLLTATPHQRGSATQFGLLNLVDPARFSDYEQFLEESERMHELADMVNIILKGSPAHQQRVTVSLRKLFAEDRHLLDLVETGLKEDKVSELLSALIDRHGTGRVYFRNRRERIPGFPKRKLLSVPLLPFDEYKEHLKGVNPVELSDTHLVDYATGRGLKRTFDAKTNTDARFQWLKEFLKGMGDKVLIICSSKERVEKVAKFLDPNFDKPAQRKVGIFHEGLSIVDRDIQAAWFAREKGAKALVCSEIGGEGRNFQFVKKLILFDLPMHPDLLEQRIGRLDRIGQGKEIDLIVPWQKDTPEEVLFSWYQEGLNAFEQSWNGAALILEEFGERLLDVFAMFLPHHENHKNRRKALDTLIESTRNTVSDLRKHVTQNIDSLVDLNSFKEDIGSSILESIDDSDDDTDLEFFMHQVFNHYGVDYEDYDDQGSILVKGGTLAFIEDFPLAKKEEEDTLVTFNRRVALAREEMIFLSMDHPLVEATLDHILLRNEGVASVCLWDHSPFGRGMLLECSLILEAKGPPPLDLGRYLPLQVSDFIVDHTGNMIEQEKLKNKNRFLSENRDFSLFERATFKDALHKLTGIVLGHAKKWVDKEKKSALVKARKEIDDELARLRYLAKVNPLVSSEEIEAMESYKSQVLNALEASTCRVDAVRMILTH